ncbi:hydroxyacid oxidase 1 [Trichonephila clavipes]|uniref:Hydroxyacid oxidase 1 n=1 Tax=Trichonephila clavipes TaxID=2585209 RepID=A0A8X6SNL0_TRICX|nr:hydroxyacid oxidase 1 [Trichonephila clavipes]
MMGGVALCLMLCCGVLQMAAGYIPRNNQLHFLAFVEGLDAAEENTVLQKVGVLQWLHSISSRKSIICSMISICMLSYRLGNAYMSSLRDYEEYATTYMDRHARDYYGSGAEDEVTLRDNEKAFQK